MDLKKIYWLYLISSCLVFCYANNVTATKKAVVVGASSGMGREVAKRLSKAGYVVGLVARRVPLLESLQDELSNFSYIKQIDVTAVDAREQLQALIDQMGGLDLMVISISPYLDNRISAAARAEQEGLSNFAPCTYELKWTEKANFLNVCAYGFIAVADVALEYFIKQNSGHLVGISSTSGLRGSFFCPEYSASKACVMIYMEGVRNYMLQNNINVYITDVVAGYVSVEHSPFGEDPTAYWEITCKQAGKEIMEGIKARKKMVYVPSKIWLVVYLRKYLPDFIYNRYFAWL